MSKFEYMRVNWQKRLSVFPLQIARLQPPASGQDADRIMNITLPRDKDKMMMAVTFYNVREDNGNR